MEQQMDVKCYVNCHTHTFTGDNVPPYLGKKMLPLFLGYLLTIPLIVGFFRYYYRYIDRQRFKWLYKKFLDARFWLTWFGNKIPPLKSLLAVWLTTDAVLILFYDKLEKRYGLQVWFCYLKWIRTILASHLLMPSPGNILLEVALVLFVVLLIPYGRNFLSFIAKFIYKFLSILPGPQTRSYLARYLNIGRFAFYADQAGIYQALLRQYPAKTKIVVLPMDMDYMEAGTPKEVYPVQLEALKKLQKKFPDTCLPFVFADPRRIRENPAYAAEIQECITRSGFRGIKTYPALGYYPFDSDLLPTLLWACENDVPVLNHCIRGTIFYRGDKKAEWNRHPFFKQSTGKKDEYENLSLYELENKDFANNFTHPLNYLCLLDETLLIKVLGQCNDPKTRQLFGYSETDRTITKNLSKLKVCFGHFGGDDEWLRYLETDRYTDDNAFNEHPEFGLNLKKTNSNENVWRYVSWFSIIYSLMLQYPNIYADISYIVHEKKIYPLLKSLLRPECKIRDKILFGTDFYVVRSQKSDKQIWSEITGTLSPDQLTQIAKINPRKFLKNKLSGDID